MKAYPKKEDLHGVYIKSLRLIHTRMIKHILLIFTGQNFVS